MKKLFYFISLAGLSLSVMAQPHFSKMITKSAPEAGIFCIFIKPDKSLTIPTKIKVAAAAIGSKSTAGKWSNLIYKNNYAYLYDNACMSMEDIKNNHVKLISLDVISANGQSLANCSVTRWGDEIQAGSDTLFIGQQGDKFTCRKE